MPMGVPGWPESACWTASIASVRIVLMQTVSRSPDGSWTVVIEILHLLYLLRRASRSSETRERVLQRPQDVLGTGGFQLIGRVRAARYSDGHGAGRPGRVDVQGGVAHDVRIGRAELGVQETRLNDGESRQLLTIGRVRTVGAEDQEPVEVGGHELGPRRTFEGARHKAHHHPG